MKVTLDENPLRLEGKKPSITLRPEDERDQHTLETLAARYDVHFGKHPETMRALHVEILLSRKYCNWDDEASYWDTACGNAFYASESGLDGMTYCPFCGRLIKHG